MWLVERSLWSGHVGHVCQSRLARFELGQAQLRTENGFENHQIVEEIDSPSFLSPSGAVHLSR